VYKQGTPDTPPTDPENLAEAIKEVVDWLKEAKQPAILAGVELARYQLGEKLIRFAEKADIPVASTLLSKSVVNERHPLYAGVYSGASSQEITRKIVEESDCLLMFGVMLTDMTLCFRPSKFKKRQVVSSSVDGLRIRNHTFTDIQFADFCNALFKLEIEKKPLPIMPPKKEKVTFEPKAETKLTTNRLFQKIDSILDRDMGIVADIGDSLFGAGDLTVHHSHQFLSPAFYTSMGSAIPGALGLQTAKPNVRPIVIVGDGAFQMSCTELGTIIRRKLNPIVFVLNNDGYTTERFLIDGGFNDLPQWDYHAITSLMKGGKGWCVQTEEELDAAVKAALENKELSVINVKVDRRDVSFGLQRVSEGLVKRL
jgi:indolepyruvate decarboxylase